MVRLNIRPKILGAIPLPPVHEPGAVQTFVPPVELERLVSCCLLGERQFYVSGEDIEARIRALAALADPERVAKLAVHARLELGLRHAPLLLLVALAERRGHAGLIRAAAADILRTPRDAMDLLALWWKPAKRPIPRSFKHAVRDGFARWSEYQLAKYATLRDVGVRLRDLLFLCHPNPWPPVDVDHSEGWVARGEARVAMFKAIAEDTVRAPDTWEAALSMPGADKRAEWERLLAGHKLGALALVRNLRNMEQAGVEPTLVREAMIRVKAADVWPWQALAAAREAPAYTHALDALMLRSAGALPRIPGKTGVLVDVSGSMDRTMSDRGSMKRLDAGCGLAVVLREACERSVIASFSNVTAILTEPVCRGTMLAGVIAGSQPHSGTQLAQAVVVMLSKIPDLDRLVVLTDEQGQDRFLEWPGKPVVVVNLASASRGMDWHGAVIRINGWSGGVVRWLAQEFAGSAGSAAIETEDAEAAI